jgi:hypothetical protein
MPIQDGKIIAPIGMGDISSALSNPSLDLFTLAQSSTINKWSKYKFFRHTGLFSDRYQGSDIVTPTSDREIAIRGANFGLLAPSMTSVIEDTLNTDWVYQKPVVGQHKVDMLDMEFYFPGAVPPAHSPGNVIFYPALQSSFDFTASMPVIITPENIKWGDLGTIQDWYLCLYIKAYRNGVPATWVKTATDTFRNGGGSLELTRLNAQTIYNYGGVGPHYYYLCASKAQNNTFDDPLLQTQYLALPAGSTAEMEGNISISSNVLANMSIALVSVAKPNASALVRSFIDASNYTGPYQEGDENAWLQLIAANNNSVHFAFDMRGLSERTVTLQKSAMKIRLQYTLWGTTSSFVPEKILDASGNEYSSITIGPGQTARYYFVLPLGAMNYNGNTRQDGPTTGQHRDVFVSLLYNDYIAGTADIRMKN